MDEAMARQLLSKYECGHLAYTHRLREIVKRLVKAGYLIMINNGKDTELTQAGKDWCCDNHMKYSFKSPYTHKKG